MQVITQMYSKNIMDDFRCILCSYFTFYVRFLSHIKQIPLDIIIHPSNSAGVFIPYSPNFVKHLHSPLKWKTVNPPYTPYKSPCELRRFYTFGYLWSLQSFILKGQYISIIWILQLSTAQANVHSQSSLLLRIFDKFVAVKNVKTSSMEKKITRTWHRWSNFRDGYKAIYIYIYMIHCCDMSLWVTCGTIDHKWCF